MHNSNVYVLLFPEHLAYKVGKAKKIASGKYQEVTEDMNGIWSAVK